MPIENTGETTKTLLERAADLLSNAINYTISTSEEVWLSQLLHSTQVIKFIPLLTIIPMYFLKT